MLRRLSRTTFGAIKSRPHYFGVPHVEEFVKRWRLLDDVHLVHDVPDTILWKFTNASISTTFGKFLAPPLIKTLEHVLDICSKTLKFFSIKNGKSLPCFLKIS
jgi:hypothetical protein